MEYFIDGFVKYGGAFGLLFAGSVIVIFFLYKENRQLSKDKVELAEKRVEDLKEAQKVNDSQAQSNRTISESNYRIAEQTFIIVQNLQQILNQAKGKQ